LVEIPEEKWKHAHRLLQCITVSSRPLRVEELGEVLSIQFDSATTPKLITGWRSENTEDTVLSACSSLIAIVKVENSLVVQFSHFSVKEFLMSNRLATAQMGNLSRYHIALEPAHEILVQACLSTLLELDEHIDKKGLKSYPLAFYAAQYWFEHARFGDVSYSIEDMMGQFFDPGKSHLSAWIWIHDPDKPWQSPSVKGLIERPSEPQATSLYYSAACGLRRATGQLVSVHSNDVNPREDSIPAPLWAATNKGFVDIASLLLQHGANPNYARGSGPGRWTLLHLALYHGFTKIIQLLLEHGADVNLTSANGRSPLQIALTEGHVSAMQLLLEHGANVKYNAPAFGRTLLIQAVQWGPVEAVRLLLQHGADVDGKDNHGKTALVWALSKKDVGAIQLLLEYGANVDHYESDYGRRSTPLLTDEVQSGLVEALSWASYNGNLEMVRALLEWGVDVHVRDGFNRTPFQIALQFGRQDIVQLLLEHGARVEENVPTIMSTP